mgnify:CR=1 FL=1
MKDDSVRQSPIDKPYGERSSMGVGRRNKNKVLAIVYTRYVNFEDETYFKGSRM